MDIFDRNPVEKLEDVVFSDHATQQTVMAKATINTASNMLFYGPEGTGKTTLCHLIGKQLVGKGYETDVFSINVSGCSSKSALCAAIVNKCGFGPMNHLGKIVIILEELDGANTRVQKALKDIFTKLNSSVLFLATTNDIQDIINPIVDRFLSVEIDVSPPNMWRERAVQVLLNEGVKLSLDQAEQLLIIEANGLSGRQIMHKLEAFALKAKLANTNIKPKKVV